MQLDVKGVRWPHTMLFLFCQAWKGWMLLLWRNHGGHLHKDSINPWEKTGLKGLNKMFF